MEKTEPSSSQRNSDSNSPSKTEPVTIEKLIHAVQYGDSHYVESAIEVHKFSPDTVDRDGCSLLHWASINGRFEIVQFLIHRRANVNLVGGDNGEIPLQWAVRQPHCAKIVDLLITENSNMSHKSIYGYDSLFLAVQAAHLHIIFLLLHRGANPNCTDLQNETPLTWLLKNKPGEHIDIIRMLIKFGANPNHLTASGNALHILTAQGLQFDFGLALMLFEAGGNNILESTNEQGKTVYQLSIETKNRQMLRFLFDAFCYTHLPKSLPIALMAVAFAANFFLIQGLGWMYGLAADLLLYFLVSPALQSTITSANSRVSCGLAWGIILTVSTSYFVFLSSYFGRQMDYVVFVTLFLIVYCLYQAMRTPPLALAAHDFEDRRQVAEKILQAPPIVNGNGSPIGIDFRICSTCLVDKSLASIHCSKCNKCVVHLDHHCPFVNNCVGKGNRRVFVFFTLFASLGCLLVFLLSLHYENYVLCANRHGWLWSFFAVQICSFHEMPIFAAIAWLAGTSAFWISCILLGQLHLIAGETTTFEMLRRRTQPRPACSGRGCRNVATFCQTGQYLVTEGAPAAPCCDHGHDHGHHGHHSHGHKGMGGVQEV